MAEKKENLIRNEREAIECITKNRPSSGYDMLKEALDMAVVALEKQIPKKPDVEGDGYDKDGNMIYDTWLCPCCGSRYEVEYDDYDYCPVCGQKLDMSYVRFRS